MRRCLPLLLVLATPALATELSFLPPAELAEHAIAALPEVQAAEAGSRRADAEARGLAAGPHEFELSLAPARRHIRGERSYSEFEGQLSRAIRLPGKARLDREIGALGRAAAAEGEAAARHAGAQALVTLWMDWLRAEAELAEAIAQRELVARDREASARRVRLGDAATRELDSADAALAQAAARVTTTRGRREAARIALAGTFPTLALPERVPALPEPSPDADSDALHVAGIVNVSHALAAAERSAERDEQAARRARAERIADPRVGLGWTSERSGEERIIGLVVDIPFGGGQRRAMADAEAASADASAATAATVRRDVRIAAEQTVARAAAAREAWQDQQRALAATRASAARTRRAYALGEAGIAELISAQRGEHEAALAELDARAAALEAEVRLRIDAHELWH